MPPSSTDQVLVAIENETGLVVVQGRGSFKISTALKQFGLAAMQAGCVRLVFNMADCVAMDSTFMGVLAGLAFELRKTNRQYVALINLTARTRGLLSTLGMDQIVKTYLAGKTPDELKAWETATSGLSHLDTIEKTPQATAQTMLEAHEQLVAVAPENLPKFKDVLSFLREDLKKMPPPPEA